MRLLESAVTVMKDDYICDWCLGRVSATLLTGYTNEQRGKIIRNFIAMLIDSGEIIDVDTSNFYGIKFRNVKMGIKKPKKCGTCENFFLEKIDELAERVAEKMAPYEFDTFLIGTIVSGELGRTEEKVWDRAGIEFVEPIKTEINRELGKRLERLTKKKFSLEAPHITAIIDLETNRVRFQVRSLYIYGKYQKLARGIPQTKWICRNCGGKGCVDCGGEGKLYKTSVQEIVEKPLIKAAKAKKSKFHGAGREDVDACCLGKRAFVIELVRPMRRRINIKKIQTRINKSKRLKVHGLKVADKKDIQEVKFSRYDKTYLAEVVFSKRIDKKKLKLLRGLNGKTIQQKTPRRVAHRRSSKIRKRKVKKISVKLAGEKKMRLKIRGEAGLYIKELITGDEGRTQPNVAELLDNKVKSIKLDVIKIHSN